VRRKPASQQPRGSCRPAIAGSSRWPIHKLLGIVTDRDICLAVATKFQSPEELPVGDIMTKKVYTCSPDHDARTALNLMTNHAVRRVPVVTTDGRLTGLISIDDLVLRADRHKGAAVSADDVIDAFRSICVRAVAA
jgi:signal-transduction protein with cAMP-binding, CBS, and nucleotidyltransferase domain